MVFNRVFQEWTLFVGYTLSFCAFGISVVTFYRLTLVSWAEELLILGVLPIFHAAFTCHRRIYLPLSIAIALISVFSVSYIVSNPSSSIEMVTFTVSMVIVSSEMVFRSMRKHRVSQKELREAREFLEAVVSQSPSGILIADAPDVKIRMANPAAFGIRGEDRSPINNV